LAAQSFLFSVCNGAILWITDHREKSGLRTKTVKIEGFPTVLFCTAKFSMEDQERTRLLSLSPDVSQDKIRDGILLKIEKESNRKAFNELMENDPKRVWLADRVDAIATADVKFVVIPEEMRAFIADRFFEIHKSLIPRHQRDITRLLALIKAHALLNMWHRQRLNESVIVNEDDILEGFNLYLKVSKANELGLPPEVYNIFVKIKDEIPETGYTRKELQALYYQTFNRTIGTKRLDEILVLLQSVGLLTEEPDPNDKRQKRFLPPPQGVFNFAVENDEKEDIENAQKIYAPQGGGNTQERSSVQEILQKIRPQFVEGTQEEWKSLAVENGLTQKEAESLFESLKGSELFWFDRDGKTFWRWVNE
jgi:hypothetical protein